MTLRKSLMNDEPQGNAATYLLSYGLLHNRIDWLVRFTVRFKWR